MKFAAIIFLTLALPAIAEKPWPKKEAEAKFAIVASADLPKGLQDTLLTYDDYEMGTEKLPDQLNVCGIRLSRSGPTDYIVMVPQGFSGGPEFNVFEERGSKFVDIGGGQGLQYLGPRVNGFYQIVMQSRGGGGNFTKMLMQYKNGKYAIARMADYKMADDKLEFVHERSADEFQPKAF